MIFMTGDVASESTQRFLRDNRKHRVSKPFSLDEFRATVRQMSEAN